MSQHIVLPVLLTDEPSCTVALNFIQPSQAVLKTLYRSVQFNAPEMNGLWFKVDGILEVRVREMVYRLEGDQHGAVSKLSSEYSPVYTKESRRYGTNYGTPIAREMVIEGEGMSLGG
ncbi:MAG TPA: hypothetical protein PKD12_09640 [Nitrospira sp.]|nr:hypothetical protein [Nitrospira sp.]